MSQYNTEPSLDLETLLDEARAMVAGEHLGQPTLLHLWAALKAADANLGAEPPPTVFGQLRLPLAVTH